MKRKIDYRISDLKSIMEDYAGVAVEFSYRTERNRKYQEENIVYIELGQNLDIFGLDDVYYDSYEKKYFIFFSTFLHHLNKATRELHHPAYTVIYKQDELETITFEII